ncbi:MAG: hypothetical protein AB7F65_05190 [Dehalococcoidia bacterium]
MAIPNPLECERCGASMTDAATHRCGLADHPSLGRPVEAPPTPVDETAAHAARVAREALLGGDGPPGGEPSSRD